LARCPPLARGSRRWLRSLFSKAEPGVEGPRVPFAPSPRFGRRTTFTSAVTRTFWGSFKDNIDWGDVALSFDLVGNVATPGRLEAYDGTTTRLLVRANGDTCAYDRAGNLT